MNMTSAPPMNITQFPFTFSSVLEAPAKDEQVVRPVTTGSPGNVRSITPGGIGHSKQMMKEDFAFGWGNYEGDGDEREIGRQLRYGSSPSDCKKYKFWVMEAMLPWDKSADIMCNGHNHWPSNVDCKEGWMEHETKYSNDEEAPCLQHHTADQHKLNTALSSFEALPYQRPWRVQSCREFTSISCGAGPATPVEVPPTHTLESHSKRYQMQGVLERYTQNESRGVEENDAATQKMEEPILTKDVHSLPQNPKRQKLKLKAVQQSPQPVEVPKRSSSCAPPSTHTVAPRLKKQNDQFYELAVPKNAGNIAPRKPATAPEKRNMPTTNPWITDWDDSLTIGFSPWGDGNELKAEKGYELCSYMQQMYDLPNDKRKEAKKKVAPKKHVKPRRNSGRSRKPKSDVTKQPSKSKKVLSRRDSPGKVSSTHIRRDHSYSLGESAECGGLGECEGEEGFGETNSIDTLAASDASDSGEEANQTRSYKRDEKLLDGGQRCNSFLENPNSEVSHDHQAESSGGALLQLDTRDRPQQQRRASAHRPPLPPYHKESDEAVKGSCGASSKKDTGCNGKVCAEIEAPGIGHGGFSAEDGAKSGNDEVSGCVSTEKMDVEILGSMNAGNEVHETPREIGLIKKLTGHSDSKIGQSLKNKLPRARQNLGSAPNVMSRRPASQLTLSTFEPLEITPRMNNFPPNTSRSHVFPSSGVGSSGQGSRATSSTHSSEGINSEASCDEEPEVDGSKDGVHEKGAICYRKIELPLKQQPDNGKEEKRENGTENATPGVLTFAPFSGSRTPQPSTRSGKSNGTAKKPSSRGSHRSAAKAGHEERCKEKGVVETKSWDFDLGQEGVKTERPSKALLPRNGMSTRGNTTKSISDCINLLWQHLPNDSAKGFSRAAHDIICKTITKVLEDDRFLDANEMWSKFASKRESLQNSPPGVHFAPQVMVLSGIKGMLLHLARVVHRVGLSIDWDVLHWGLLSGLKAQITQDVVSNGRTELTWPSARETPPTGSLPGAPESSSIQASRQSDQHTIRPRSVPESLQLCQRTQPTSEVYLQGRASGAVRNISRSPRRHDNSFVVLLPLSSSSRWEEPRLKHRTRGGSGSSPAVPTSTSLRSMRKIASL